MSRQDQDVMNQGPNLEVDPEGEETVLTAGDGDGGAPWVLDGPDDDAGMPEDVNQPPAGGGQQPPSGQPRQSQQGQQFEIRTATGHVFRGNTAQEAYDAARSWESQQTQDYSYDNPTPRQPSYRQPPPEQYAPGWDDAAFFKLMGTNPREALHQFMQDYFEMEDPREAFATSYTVSKQVSDRIATADFLTNNPDFPASPRSADILMRRIAEDGAAITSGNMEIAFRQLVREGRLAPVQQQQQDQGQGGQPQPPRDYRQGYEEQEPDQGPPQRRPGQQPPRIPPPSRGAGAPPSAPNRGTVPGADQGDGSGRLGDRVLSEEQFNELSADDMKAYLDRRWQIENRRRGPGPTRRGSDGF